MQKAYIKEKSSGAGVDVHLMISASTRPSPGKCIARDGGYVVQCKGNNSDDAKNKAVSAQIYKMERVGCVRDGLNGVGGEQATWAKSPTTDKREPIGTKTFYWEDQRDHRIVIYDPLYF